MVLNHALLASLKDCSSENIAYTSFPLCILLCALIFLGYQRRFERNKRAVPPLIKRKLSRISMYGQVALVSTKILCDGYFLFSSLDICNSLDHTSRLLNSLGLLVMLGTFPPIDDFRAANHITCLIIVYFCVFLEAINQVFSAPTFIDVQYPMYMRLAISFLLFTLASTIPYPLSANDADVNLSEYGVIEVKNNHVYRDGRPLIPEASTSLFSWISYGWLSKFIIIHYKKPPAANDIYAMMYNRLARVVYSDFEAASYVKLYRKLWLRLFMANRMLFCISITTCFLSLCWGYLSLYFQQRLIQFVETPDGRSNSVAYGFAFGMFFAKISANCINTVQDYTSQMLKHRTVTMLNVSIFKKTLQRKDMSGKIEKSEESDNDQDTVTSDEKTEPVSSNGKIANLMSNDSWNVAYAILHFDRYAFTPVNIFMASVYLYYVLGAASLVGWTIAAVLLPLNLVFARAMSGLYQKCSEAEDKCANLVNELLHGIRLIKFFAWEANWREKILQARKATLKMNLRLRLYYIAMDSIATIIPLLVAVISFIWYTKVTGNELTASVAFVSINLFKKLGGPIMQIPDMINNFSELKVSLDRISNFFDEPEINQEMYSALATVPEGKQPEDVLVRVGFEDSIFQWHCEPIPPVLSSATSVDSGLIDRNFQLCVPAFDFPVGCLTIVCGPTGSGKSSFLSALLGEMDAVSGRVHLPSKCQIAPPVSRIDSSYPDLLLDKVAYVCQRPFLQHDTIRNNILFGEPFDPARYKKVISQCCLVADLSLWPDRDLTEIGQKGITLSGGQKQRVSLARAVYSHAKTVLIDDCLSAVDSHTARHIYEKCINGELLKGRTVILTTHHIHLCLPTAKFLVKIEDGHVVWHGPVEEAQKRDKLQKLIGYIVQTEQESSAEIVEEDFKIATDKDSAQKLIAEEESVKGGVDFKVCVFYVENCGVWLFGLIVVIAILMKAATFSEYWWLREWSLAYDEAAVIQPRKSSSELAERIDVNYYILVYALLCSTQVIFEMADTFIINWGTMKGSVKIYQKLLLRLTHAPMRFFDTTPVGRILNRFCGDMETVDYSLASGFNYIVHAIVGMVTSTLVISVITPEFIIASFLAGAINIVLGSFYINISRELKRNNSIQLSPIYSLFSETLDGITTIRAYTQQDRFMSTIFKMQDAYMTPAFLLYATNRWFSIRLVLSGAILTLLASIFILWRLDDIDAGLVGLSLLYVGDINSHLSSLIHFYANLQVDLTAAERVQEYTLIEQEPPSIIEGCRPPAAWPTTAAIQVRNLEIRYTPELDPVLHSISFDVRPHEKIGVVGRTGSGKSTLAQSFFRFVEATRGSITIDGINIFDIGLQDLRSRITIIPQDAELFSGTIRTNLDPFNDHSDNELWESLQRVYLTQPPKKLSYIATDGIAGFSPVQYPITSLDQPVSDGGNNYSQGERQLICMARALLRNSRLVIMDEATASVDFDMDAQVQKTIRQEFADATLICIAHRLRTVIDYDRILVLSQGNIVEYDTPHNLLSQPTGVFISMCEKSGELDVLVDMVKNSSQRKVKISKLADDHSQYH